PNASGAACRERRSRPVPPPVTALHGALGKVHVVVLDERAAPLEPPFLGVPVHALEHLLPGLVGWVGLPREEDLHRTPRVDEKALQSVRIVEEQVRPLVGGKPATKPDRQRMLIEQDASANEMRGLLPLVQRAPPSPLPNAPH